MEIYVTFCLNWKKRKTCNRRVENVERKWKVRHLQWTRQAWIKIYKKDDLYAQ